MILKNNLKRTIFYGRHFLPEHLKFDIKYHQVKRLIKKSEFWSEDEIYSYQLNQLKKLIKHAYINVPYYSNLFKNEGIIPSDIKEIEDIKKLPYLTKDLINQNREFLIAHTVKKSRMRYCTTGGSTGTPLGFYNEKGHGWIEWAFMTNQWERIGYKDSAKCAVLRGGVVKNIIEGKKYWSHNNWFHPNWLIMSSYHLNDENVPLYIEKLIKYKPDFIQAYPSTLQIITRYMKNNEIPPFEGLKGVFCGSENIYDWQRQLFENVLKTRIFSWYGHSETVCLAGECEISTQYHSFPHYGYTELINNKNEWCSMEEEKGEIISTGFWNYYFPLIRYRTQDIGVNTNELCDCGRKWKIIKTVEGRLQDYVIGKNNEKITLTALIFAQHFNAFNRIKQMQLYQKIKGEVLVRVIESEILTKSDREEIKSKMVKASHNSLNVSIDNVKYIPRTSSGKHRFLIQELNVK